MPKLIDLTGKKFQHLIALYRVENKGNKTQWMFRCECGKTKEIPAYCVTQNRIHSCGCKAKAGGPIQLSRLKKQLMENVKISEKGCWEWQRQIDKDGYGFWGLPSIKMQRVHRISWFLHNGKIPEDMLILHHCDNPPCCNPEHLYVGTVKDNLRDSIERGLFPFGPNPKKAQKGEKNPKAKLTEDMVKYIRFLCDKGFNKKEMASFFNVHITAIRNILLKKTWRHI